MKKILLLLLVTASIFVLGACARTSELVLENRVEDLEQETGVLAEELSKLEQKMLELETLYENLIPSVGLNGQTSYYVNSDGGEIFLSLSTFTRLSTDKDFIDTSKFPEYILDLNGEYISIQDLGDLLVHKYFGSGVNGTYTTGIQYKLTFTIDDTEMSNEEFITRLSMLVMELSNYDFYTIDSPQLYFYVYFNSQTVELKSRMSLLVSDKYDIVEEIFYLELLDVNITGVTFDTTLVTQYRDEFVSNETFIGYVLNYR